MPEQFADGFVKSHMKWLPSKSPTVMAKPESAGHQFVVVLTMDRAMRFYRIRKQ